MLEMNETVFLIFAVIAIAFALLTVFLKSAVASAFSLVVVFFAFAGIYAAMGAHLIAALQILVYTGAIMVLFAFVIMLLSSDVPSLDLTRAGVMGRGMIGLGGVALGALLIQVFFQHQFTAPLGGFDLKTIDQLGGNTRVLSELLFSEYLFPFELTSILLLAAIVGAVAIAKRKGKTIR